MKPAPAMRRVNGTWIMSKATDPPPGRLSLADFGLLVSDIDGTLVRSDKTLDPATIGAVGILRASSVPTTLISARPPSGMDWIIEAFDLTGPFAAFNGGTLFRHDGGVIERHCLDRDVAETVLSMLMTSGVTVWVFGERQWFATDDRNPRTGHGIKSAKLHPIVTHDFSDWIDGIDKIGVSDDQELLDALERKTLNAVGRRATVTRSQLYYLDVTASQAN
jgi:HAD superfamily hydrolase (TIGR01484 family)